MYSVYQHWDPLQVCLVGKSYPPDFYSFIENKRVRSVMERIAIETEEDFQLLDKKLKSLGVTTLRSVIHPDRDFYLENGKYVSPPMTPRDHMAMVGHSFYINARQGKLNWDRARGPDWPMERPDSPDQIPPWIANECQNLLNLQITDFFKTDYHEHAWAPAIDLVQAQSNDIHYAPGINTATMTRIGRDLYFGTETYDDDQEKLLWEKQMIFQDYRCHVVNTGGHSDGTFCPVKPGLIVSLCDIPTYATTFPDWEVVYLPGQSWDKVTDFLDLKKKNKGKWWVPGEELNDEFTDFVETWLKHWVGYVEESVFDVNMLVVDQNNVICSNYNKEVFDAFNRHGITAHIVPFRHRYFWDGGIHCVTSDLHRAGYIQDFFPNRN
jgi:hypothetical protein